MRHKRWIIFLAGCLVALLGAGAYWFGAGDHVETVPFLKQTSLAHVSFQDQWEQFRQKAGISDDARLEEFHLIHDQQQNAVSIQIRIIDEEEGRSYSYFYKKCFSCPTESEEGQELLRKSRRDVQRPALQLVEADRFFRMLDVGMQDQTIPRNEFAYYLIASDGSYESIALPGIYYRVNSSGLERLTFAGLPQADGFHIHIRGSETPGPFSSGEKDIHLLF